ncbi:MAG: hypothetical protein H0U74_22230 [Bradymonadaceae bacterium]|nr:hypothetical protein [Lujinxingiaceae bacterium]
MSQLSDKLIAVSPIDANPIARRLVPLVTHPTGLSSAGFPYLERHVFERFRDTIPHLFAMGLRVLEAQQAIQSAADTLEVSQADRDNIGRACRVVRQIVYTAAITAPSDLWLLRHVVGIHTELGLTGRLLAGEAINPQFCEVEIEGKPALLDAEQLEIDLHFLLARGLVEPYDTSFRIAGHARVREVLGALGARPAGEPIPMTPYWTRLFAGERLSEHEAEVIARVGASAPAGRSDLAQSHWIATRDEVEIGYRLVPLVLGLRAVNRTSALLEGVALDAEALGATDARGAGAALSILEAAGWAERVGEGIQVSAIGARGFSRAPGPFGIIQTYHPYLARGAEILVGGRKNVWVTRGENVGASQDANRATFMQANDALDRFCADSGFDYSVFIEHAIGRGEATRQRFERTGDARVRYFGADLEDAAIDAALLEQRAGRLPANMVFVRQADIGKPELLIDALVGEGVSPRGAVMLVGNGFHEVREQTDEKMVEIFRGYHEAGILLLFTEENALSIDDLRATAWNTYHAGFKYVHEKSGQCLRPASPRAQPRLGPALRAAWSECAARAGYVRLDDYCTASRTIYPYPRKDRHNPSISVNHFFVPAWLKR